MAFEADVKAYLRAYQREYRTAQLSGQHTAELSFRTPLDTLFRNLASDLNPTGNVGVILEPRRQGRVGRPDWCIQDRSSLGVYGYIEGKGPSESTFDLAPHQAQIERYLTLGHKLIITDGIEFVFCFSNTPIRVSIIDKARLGAADWSRLSVDPQFRMYMEQFFTDPAPQYVDEGRLVELVAIRTRNLADEIMNYTELTVDEAVSEEERTVISLLTGLKDLVYNHNDPSLRTGAVFADFVAQVIMFSLLYAHRVLCTSTDTPAQKAQKIREYINRELEEQEALHPFRNLMVYIREHNGADTFLGQWIEECISFLSFVQMTDQQLLNPDYHRLFELFLTKFDKQTKFDYGAFYTPKVLADFVVRLTNQVVANEFDGASIYDDGNTIIDPCCGTGSFLEQIVAHDARDGAYHLCGFEILPAPYMLANYRMAMVRQHYGRQNVDTNILLANSLSNYLLGENANSHSIEGQELLRANHVASMPLKLIIGNPPCSDSLRGNVEDDFSRINDMMEDFRPPVEKRHGRQNIQKQINNPFMQFLRWSCEKLLHSPNHSALAFVVPLSFLEAESYQYARKYLVEHFSKIWVVAVDVDARTGIRGDSLFNTMQGRAVIVLSRRYGEETPISEFHYLDLSRERRAQKTAALERNIDHIMASFQTYPVTDGTYGLLPTRPFDKALYNKFWPISSEGSGKAVFLYQCSGAKMAPTALVTHVKQPMLKRRSREIAAQGILKAREWIDKQDRKVEEAKIKAFQDAMNTCTSRQEMDRMFEENIRPCSFRPYVTSNALLWDTVFRYQFRVAGHGARIRPEIKAIYEQEDTVGFSLAHAPKDLDEKLGQFASFCWYFPDNDLCGRGGGHIYLNQYIPNKKINTVVNNLHPDLLQHIIDTAQLSESDAARKMVFYAYAVFCSQVYLEEFNGALFKVSQSEQRARIPIVSDKTVFLKLADLGERIANLEKNNAIVENLLSLDYDGLLNQLPDDFHLEHRKSKNKTPYDEVNECIVLRDEQHGSQITVPCPAVIQRFTVSGYNVIKDCWIKFHSYRFTHCSFTRDDFKEFLDLLNKIQTQMMCVREIDEILHRIIHGDIPLYTY